MTFRGLALTAVLKARILLPMHKKTWSGKYFDPARAGRMTMVIIGMIILLFPFLSESGYVARVRAVSSLTGVCLWNNCYVFPTIVRYSGRLKIPVNTKNIYSGMIDPPYCRRRE